jgi:hypothetical protein
MNVTNVPLWEGYCDALSATTCFAHSFHSQRGVYGGRLLPPTRAGDLCEFESELARSAASSRIMHVEIAAMLRRQAYFGHYCSRAPLQSGSLRNV